MSSVGNDPTTDTLRATRDEAPKVRFGLRGRLFTAFGAVAALTVGASAVGVLSYEQIDKALAVIARDSLPAMDLSLRVSKHAADITAAGPRLLNAASAKDTAPRPRRRFRRTTPKWPRRSPASPR
jgi:hypothetical protein